jgi:hypothetical protein
MTSCTKTVNLAQYVPGTTSTTTGTARGTYGSVNYGETTEKSGYTKYVPTQITVHTRGVSLTAYDAAAYRKNKSEVEVWRVCTISSGQSSDLRYILDYLLVSAFKFFGINSKQDVYQKLDVDDQEVKHLREKLSSSLDFKANILLKGGPACPMIE